MDGHLSMAARQLRAMLARERGDNAEVELLHQMRLLQPHAHVTGAYDLSPIGLQTLSELRKRS